MAARDPIADAARKARESIDALEAAARPAPGDPLVAARRLYRERRTRDAALPAELFGEPAWDLLLGLYISRADAEEVSVTRAAELACAKMTTALRLIDRLEREGLVKRQDGSRSRRVTAIALTKAAAERLEQHLASSAISASTRASTTGVG